MTINSIEQDIISTENDVFDYDDDNTHTHKPPNDCNRYIIDSCAFDVEENKKKKKKQ